MSPHTSRRRRAAGLLLLSSVGCATAGCGSAGPGADPAAPGCTTPPAVELTGVMAAFDLTGVAHPTRSIEEGGFFVVNAVSSGNLSDLVIRFTEIVQEAGFDFAGSEDEGFEGEVFFASGDVAAGLVLLRESDCAGMVDIKISLLDNPLTVPSGSSSAT